jgi:hypothetical protein
MREVMPERYIRISQKDSRSQALHIRHGAFDGSVYLSDNHSINSFIAITGAITQDKNISLV